MWVKEENFIIKKKKNNPNLSPLILLLILWHYSHPSGRWCSKWTRGRLAGSLCLTVATHTVPLGPGAPKPLLWGLPLRLKSCCLRAPSIHISPFPQNACHQDTVPPFSNQLLRVFYIWRFTSHSFLNPPPPGFHHHHLLAWLLLRSSWLLMANPMDPFQPFPQKYLALLTMPPLSLTFVGATWCLTYLANIFPFLIAAPRGATTWLGGCPPTASMGIPFPWLKELVQDG